MSLGNNSKKSSSTQQSKSNYCPVSLEFDKSSSKVSKKIFFNSRFQIKWIYFNTKCDKSISTISNNSGNTTSATKSNTNESTATVECNK